MDMSVVILLKIIEISKIRFIKICLNYNSTIIFVLIYPNFFVDFGYLNLVRIPHSHLCHVDSGASPKLKSPSNVEFFLFSILCNL